MAEAMDNRPGTLSCPAHPINNLHLSHAPPQRLNRTAMIIVHRIIKHTLMYGSVI